MRDDKTKIAVQGRPRRRRGIYLLPNLFTTAALFAGFYGIVAAMAGRFEAAAIAVYLAMVLDGLDGRVARLTHTESEFGVQYDSLSDMVSFGVAPAIIMYIWGLRAMAELGPVAGKLGWLAAFLYAACTALRLARFNVQVGSTDKRYFIGLPCPSAAAIVMGLVWVAADLELQPEQLHWVAFVVTLGAGILMVSNVLYFSFKDLDFRRRLPFVAAFLIVAALVLASIKPSVILFSGFTIYGLSGLALTLLRWRRRAHRGSRTTSPPN